MHYTSESDFPEEVGKARIIQFPPGLAVPANKIRHVGLQRIWGGGEN